MGIVINDSVKPTTTYPTGTSSGGSGGERPSMANTNAEIARRLRASR